VGQNEPAGQGPAAAGSPQSKWTRRPAIGNPRSRQSPDAALSVEADGKAPFRGRNFKTQTLPAGDLCGSRVYAIGLIERLPGNGYEGAGCESQEYDHDPQVRNDCFELLVRHASLSVRVCGLVGPAFFGNWAGRRFGSASH
jgi:hypothetical protein